MLSVQKCKYKYTEGWCAKKKLKNKAVETTASYMETFSVAIWWFMYKFNATRHFTEELSQEECQSLLHHTYHLESQATTTLHFETGPFSQENHEYTQIAQENVILSLEWSIIPVSYKVPFYHKPDKYS